MIEALEPVDIIFFGAHPDDIELSCGGTIAKSVADGLRVRLELHLHPALRLVGEQ